MTKRRQMVVDTEGIIGFLQDNLRDRYKDCFSIIQELLQNADDAKAKRVHFGMFKGIPNAGSLFQGPALLVVNDGPVRSSDLDAIYRIAAGNKRADDNKIGKFGLGMKSVFHVCEAFFMFGKGLDVQEDLPGFCSPWSEDFHKEWWDEWDQDINIATRALEDIIGPLVKSWPRWFCVWIPMRNAKQLGYIAPILKTMPDIGTYEELVGADSCEKAARMLPLLKNIEELSFKDWDGECRKYVLKSKGRLLPESCILSGDVVAEGKGGSGFSYFGEARLHNTDRQFLELQSLDCWPESTHKELLRKAETIVDKTKPHTAVCIMTEASSSPHVSVLPCVFLPLSGAYDKTDEYSADSGGKLAVRVCLHGSMFVDAGRQGFNIGNKLLNLPKNDIELRGEWNRRLFFDAVLPMLIPQVKKLLAEVDKEESIAIMKALSQIEYLSEHMTQICHDNFLVYELTSTGYSWNVVSAKDEIFALSSPRSSLVRKVLCESLPEHVHIIDSSAGCLVKNNIIKSSLSSEIRVAVLWTIAGMPQEESNNEDLLRFARDCASGLKFPELDEDLRLAPIWKVGNDRLSYEAIKIKSEELQIYSESISGLKQKFLSAVEWTVFSAPWELGAALGLQFRKLDVDFAIDVLHKHPRLKTVEERIDLLVALKSNAAQDWARQRSAVRYLIHGVAELFDNDAKLYTPDTSLPAEFSEVVMKALSRALYHYSYSIPLKMLAKLSDEEQIEYGFGRLTKDSVAVTLANTPNISYIGFQEDAWQTLLRVSDRLFTDHMVKSALKRIPIFPFENGKRGALDDDSCYYESNVKIPTVFRETINVISIPKDEDIARRIKELVKSWRYADTFRFCRKSLLPCNQLSEILTDAIIRTPSLSAEDRAYLVETKWVPMSKGGYCQPDSIINIDGFEPTADITSKVPLNAFEDSVLSFLRRHSLLTDVTICVERFFAELAENPRYCLGRIRQSDGEDLSCDTIFSVFKNQEVLPVVSILKGMSGNKSICDNYLRLLIRPIDSDLMLGVITELTTQIRECRAPSEKQCYWRFLNSYLDEAAEYDESVFGDIFSVYEFLNLKNTLAKASELCTGGESIPSRYIISSEYKAAIKFFSRLHDNQTYYVKENKDTEYSSYKEYFSDWDQDYDARIGGFIICTSDSDEDIKFVKERYWTDSRSIRENRNKLNGSYDEFLKGQCAYLHAKKGSKVLIRTLIGTFHEVSMKGLDEVDNLFVSEGAPLHISPSPSTRLAVYNGGGPKLMIMRLRYVTKEELQRLSPARVDSLLKNTLHEIASRLCGTYACDIDNFWNDLANASQLSISVTREVMLNHASYYLGMLGCRDEKLNQIFEKQKDLETEMVDARKSKGDDIRRCLLQKDEILRKIGTLIETDAEISQHILEALRYEMRNRYEYNETSILYELFQNADDASEQLYTINPNEETGHGRFEVRYDGETLIIAHWGRLINSVVASGGAGLVHREFKRDLENMLVLMQSGKKNTDISVTGKFGLGFKTVFFVCDEPIVYSGGLRFKIHGGFLPQPLSEEDNEKYSSIVREFSDGSTDLKPTVFILPIVSSLRKKVEVWIESFIRNSQTVCTLSKRISRMRIVTNNGVKSVCKVMEDSVLAADDKRYVINFSDGCLFFGNNDGMPCALPDDEATYWATVPTKLCLKMGVALNGNFDLTTGRAKINDSSEKNPKLVRQWSRQLFDALIKIREETENLDDGGYEFWRAIWDLFTVREHIDRWDNSETNLLYDLIWDKQSGGYQCYLWQAPSIPSGLDGVLRVLCLPNDISHVVSREVVNSGALALLEEGSLTPGCAISEEVFIKPARKFLKKVKGLKKYGLYEFIADLKKERPVLDWQWCSSDAGMCLLKMLKECELDFNLRNELRDFLFMTNGSATKKGESLVGVDGHDKMRMKFVPADYQLSSKYDETGIEIFKLIRGERRIHKDVLARLAANASTITEQSAVLEYVLESKDFDFAPALVASNPPWFKSARDNPYFIRLGQNERMVLAGMLGLGVEVVTSTYTIAQLSPKPEIDIRSLDWRLVVEWWKINSETHLCKYNDLVYDRKTVCDLPRDVSTFEGRSEWLELFVLSAAFSLGMRECQHKGFIRMLKHRRMGSRTLWEIYCDENIVPEDWMNTLDAFIEAEEFCAEYQYWMRLFMRIYQFASHLSEYVQFVKMIDNIKSIKSFESIWNIKKNPMLSGSGIDLPGLQNALCTRGRTFLVRELVRRKAISNSCVYPYCFVSKGSLFNGEDSKSIYNRISFNLHKEDATFGGAFDIALVSFLKVEKKVGINYVF